MSIVMEILQSLWEAELNYKGVKVNGFGIPKFLLQNKSTTVSSTLSRLKHKGYVKFSGKGWILTPEGKNYYKGRKILRQFNSPFSKSTPKDLLVIFDIPETKKYKREWFRKHLRKFDYIMIQKSVWVGPRPLPKEFIAYAKEIGIKDCVKTFGLTKPYGKKLEN